MARSLTPPGSETACVRSTLEGQRDLLELFTRSAGDMLDQWFESDPIKAILGFDGIVGTYDSPYAAGDRLRSAASLLGRGERQERAFGAMRSAAWARVAQAIARACAERNVQIRTNCAVNDILIETGRAVGVVTDKGEKLMARAVVSNLHPKLTFETASRSCGLARRLPRPDRFLSQRLGLLPDEPRAQRTAELFGIPCPGATQLSTMGAAS